MSENDVIAGELIEAPARNGSRFNAVKHGLYAKTAVLPGEDLLAFQARVAMYSEGLQPRNELQEDLALKAALASWQHDRAVEAEKSRAEDELEALEKAASRERVEALALGSRLLFDRRGATEMYASREYQSKQPKTSFSNDPCDPDQPERLVLQLEETVAGCRLLLGHWSELRALLERGQGWQSREKLVVSRLLGMQPMNVVHKPELAKIFLACHVIEPQYNDAFRELRCELDEHSYNRYNLNLRRRDVEALTPADATAARAILLKVVDDASERLRAIETALDKKAEEKRARERAMVRLGISKTSEQMRRAQASFNRLMLRNMDAVRRSQREEDRGWELVRKAREERKALRRDKNKRDLRMVMDADGKVHDAAGYTGDLEAGLERFEQKFGPQNNDVSVERNMRQAIPDYARWKSPADESGQASGTGRGRGFDLHEPDISWAYEYSARVDETERRERAAAVAAAAEAEANAASRYAAELADANLQNEAVASAALAADHVTLNVTETGAGENIRNEIEDGGRSWQCAAGLGPGVSEESVTTGALEQVCISAESDTPIDAVAQQIKADAQARTEVVQATEAVPVILAEQVLRENIRNEIEDEELMSEMDDDDLARWAEEAGGSELPDIVDDSLEGVEGLLPHIAKFLREQRKKL